jgi:hypothetical protein
MVQYRDPKVYSRFSVKNWGLTLVRCMIWSWIREMSGETTSVTPEEYTAGSCTNEGDAIGTRKCCDNEPGSSSAPARKGW